VSPRLTRAAALALAVLLLPAIGSAKAQALDTVAAHELDVHERWMVGSINDARQAVGLRRLVVSNALMRASSDYAEYLRARRHFDHTDLEGRSPRDRAMAAGWPTNQVSEVLVAGTSIAPLAFTSWMESPGHKASLLAPAAEYIGMARDSIANYYWVGVTAAACPIGQEAACESTGDSGDSSLRLYEPSPKTSTRSPQLRVSIRRRGRKLIVRIHALGKGRISVCLRRIPSRYCVLKRFRMNTRRSRRTIKVRPGRWRAVVLYDGNRRWRGQRRITRTVRVSKRAG
jgi:hypothetical protein